jgi:selenide,water dikinase
VRPLQALFRPEEYPELLVGLGAPDDAAVWRLSADQAVVVTTDFFTLVVDGAYDYGAIAAANALSDLYAMGARPILALNVAAMPPDLPIDLIGEIFRGGAEKVRQAGAVLAGGHTVQDQEPKFGLVAVGLAAPDRLMTKGGARPGDVLGLTKPLGTGVTTTALKRGVAEPAHVEQAIGWMSRLNADASALGLEHGVRGATDITGYGLLGHGLEMAEASRVRLVLQARAIPFLAGARVLVLLGIPGGAQITRCTSARSAPILHRRVFTQPVLTPRRRAGCSSVFRPPRSRPSSRPPLNAISRFGLSEVSNRGRASRSGIRGLLLRRPAEKAACF